MKILHTVEFYRPSVGGMQEVVKQLSERLVKLGHDVTAATSWLSDRREKVLNGVKIKDFHISGNAVRGYQGNIREYQDFLLASRFDIVTNFAAQQWATDLTLPILDRIRAKKVLVPTGFSGLYWPAYSNYFQKMPLRMKQYDMNVFLSNDYRDVNLARKHKVKKITLIPNGAGADEFLAPLRINFRQLLGIPKEHTLILHVGSHTGVKGHREAIKIFSAANINHITFVIVGNNFGGGCTVECRWKARLFRFNRAHREQHKRLIVTELDRKSTVAGYQTADLFLTTSNIECSPLVLFESAAAKTPFLTTDVGNAKEIIKWTGGGELLPTRHEKDGMSFADVDSSVAVLEKLVADAPKRKRLAESGYTAWQKRFSWEKIVQDYEKLYKKLLSR